MRQLLPKNFSRPADVDEAIRLCSSKSARSGNDAESYNLLCRAYFMIDEWDRGIPACERASNLDPDNSLYHLWLGRIYGEKADRAGFFRGRRTGEKSANFVRARRGAGSRKLGSPHRSWRSFISKLRLSLAEARTKPARRPTRSCRSIRRWRTGSLARIAERNKDAAAAEREYRAAIAASHSECAPGWTWRYFCASQPPRRNGAGLAQSRVRARSTARNALMDGASILLRAGRDYPLAVRLLRRYLASPVEEGPAFKAHELLGQLLEKQGDRRAAAEQYRAALALVHDYAARPGRFEESRALSASATSSAPVSRCDSREFSTS